ncbi:pyridoxal phosphate-dependent aminotransferase [Capnocytophaga sp. oral taxon 878]|uniref:pyridoxal phosphate-dependent aminotransferase n=1 Tax=Capnocytophaga sp. oral taxon 878 TaxID=1316596 RepID=UPI000D027CAA|nr:pyridoxal phosphate-dependent aminotransferase [Capnocytophaga sp. oral taxon 878]AVM49248.1 aspartate aminotransferase [Capnocytophaga sp. oral taxon 878]
MPKISHRAEILPLSPIRKLTPYAEKAVKEGKTIYHLNIGQPDIKTPEIAVQAVKDFTPEVLEYTKSQGVDSLREKVVGYYAKHDISIDKDDLIITCGGSEALIYVVATVANADDEIIIPEPYYANYISFSEAFDAVCVPITSSFDNNFALPPIEEFEKKITSKTKAFLICNPGNPTGYLYSKEEILQLAAIAKKHDLFLIFDEVYREFVYDGASHYSIMQVQGIEQNAIMIDSVSKRFSMCGARIGWVVSKNKQVLKSVLKFAQARLSPPTYSQIAAERAFDVPETYFTEVIDEYTKRRKVLIEELQKVEGVRVSMPKGAFYCIAELPVKNAEDFCIWLLDKYALNNETVMLAPAEGFYATKGLGYNQVRIAYVLKEEKIVRAISILREALKQYNKN